MEKKAMTRLRRFFRYSPCDAFPALGSLGTLVVLVNSFLWFDRLPGWALAVAFAGLVFGYCWNVQSISHNFIHNPFFTSDWLNRAFSVLETLVMGVPQTIYHHYHLNHHWGDNDAPGPDGTTKDWGSTYRHGKDGKPEAFWSYCLIGFFRFELGPCFRMIGRQGRKHVTLVAVEALALGALWLGMVLVDWRYFVIFYLPSYYLGWVLTYAHTYALHYRATPGNDYANSVSSYHRLYNRVFFNNGYHQEHHWDPKAHWTRMADVRREILPHMIANGTRVIRGPHITVFLEDWLNRKQAPPNDPLETAEKSQWPTAKAA
jgi:fatty acid desaturase